MVGDPALPKGAVKLLLNLGMIAGDALVRGGRLDVGAERDGGAVRGVSTPGTGSSFWLELPAQPTVAAPGPTT